MGHPILKTQIGHFVGCFNHENSEIADFLMVCWKIFHVCPICKNQPEFWSLFDRRVSFFFLGVGICFGFLFRCFFVFLLLCFLFFCFSPPSAFMLLCFSASLLFVFLFFFLSLLLCFLLLCFFTVLLLCCFLLFCFSSPK